MQATATGAFHADRDGVNTSGSAHVPDIRVVDFQEASGQVKFGSGSASQSALEGLLMPPT
jgi:hypothetical protein